MMYSRAAQCFCGCGIRVLPSDHLLAICGERKGDMGKEEKNNLTSCLGSSSTHQRHAYTGDNKGLRDPWGIEKLQGPSSQGIPRGNTCRWDPKNDEWRDRRPQQCSRVDSLRFSVRGVRMIHHHATNSTSPTIDASLQIVVEDVTKNDSQMTDAKGKTVAQR